MGKEAVDAAKDGKEAGCPWFINSPESNYCYFQWAAENAGTQFNEAKIAQLLLITDDAVKRIISNFKRRSQHRNDLDE